MNRSAKGSNGALLAVLIAGVLMGALDIDPLPGRSYEIQWFDESSDTDPVDTLTVEL